MKTLIVYATKHGCTEKCAEELSGLLEGEVNLCNLKKEPFVDISQYDVVIIGGSIYAGRIQNEVRNFCEDKMNFLDNKRIGLFICCLFEGEKAETQILSSFPKELLEKAISKQCFGGEFNLSGMNFFEKIIVRMVTKTGNESKNKDIKDMPSKIISKNIRLMAETMNKA